tara:strand:- start:154 stop:417 length:264 start_codon:yes stop_codon:yes gene_type:complete
MLNLVDLVEVLVAVPKVVHLELLEINRLEPQLLHQVKVMMVAIALEQVLMVLAAEVVPEVLEHLIMMVVLVVLGPQYQQLSKILYQF